MRVVGFDQLLLFEPCNGVRLKRLAAHRFEPRDFDAFVGANAHKQRFVGDFFRCEHGVADPANAMFVDRIDVIGRPALRFDRDARAMVGDAAVCAGADADPIVAAPIEQIVPRAGGSIAGVI